MRVVVVVLLGFMGACGAPARPRERPVVPATGGLAASTGWPPVAAGAGPCGALYPEQRVPRDQIGPHGEALWFDVPTLPDVFTPGTTWELAARQLAPSYRPLARAHCRSHDIAPSAAGACAATITCELDGAAAPLTFRVASSRDFGSGADEVCARGAPAADGTVVTLCGSGVALTRVEVATPTQTIALTDDLIPAACDQLFAPTTVAVSLGTFPGWEAPDLVLPRASWELREAGGPARGRCLVSNATPVGSDCAVDLYCPIARDGGSYLDTQLTTVVRVTPTSGPGPTCWTSAGGAVQACVQDGTLAYLVADGRRMLASAPCRSGVACW